MSIFLVPIGIIVVLLASSYGWGSLVARAIYGQRQPAGFSSALGCAVWIFVGGVLNITHTIGPFSLNALIVVGIGLTLLDLLQSPRPKSDMHPRPEHLPKLIILVVTAFYAFTLLPTTAFNFHDDFHTYLLYPMQMLQTGAAGTAVDDLRGYGTLTAQSFLLSPLLLYLPISFANGFDLVFCYMVCGFLIDDIGKKAGLHWLFRLIPVLAFILIHPLYVNLSALYSGSLMVLGLLYASRLAAEVEPGKLGALIVGLLPPALFASCLASLKLTFVGFVAVYVVSFIAFFPALGWQARQAIWAGASLISMSLLLALPWAAVSLSSYSELIGKAIANITGSGGWSYDGSDTSTGPMGLFSASRLSWGGSFIAYLLMLFAIALALAGSMRRLWRSERVARDRNLIVGASAFIAVLLSTVLISYQVRPDLTVRYATPLLIAVFPMTISLLASSLSLQISQDRAVRMSTLGAILLIGQVLVMGQFVDVFATNLSKALRQGTILSFPLSGRGFTFIHSALARETRDAVRAAQDTIPQGEPFFAWLATPFHLDFARNGILTLDTPGLAVLADRVDLESGHPGFVDYLRRRGIRYLMWNENSPGMRGEKALEWELNTRRQALARDNLKMIQTMRALSDTHVSLFDDGSLVVIDIGEG